MNAPGLSSALSSQRPRTMGSRSRSPDCHENINQRRFSAVSQQRAAISSVDEASSTASTFLRFTASAVACTSQRTHGSEHELIESLVLQNHSRRAAQARLMTVRLTCASRHRASKDK